MWGYAWYRALSAAEKDNTQDAMQYKGPHFSLDSETAYVLTLRNFSNVHNGLILPKREDICRDNAA